MKEMKVPLADIHARLAEAKRLNDAGQHGSALKQAHHASECLAAAYLASTAGQTLPPNDTTFEQFYEIIQEPERHPKLLSKIEDVVGDAYVLREAYAPALLDETTHEDARQMINKISELHELIERLLNPLNCT